MGQQRSAEGVVSLRVGRLKLNGSSKLSFGLAEFGEAEESAAEVDSGFDLRGKAGDNGFEVRDRFVCPTDLPEHGAESEMGISGRRIETQRLFEIGQGIVWFAGDDESGAKSAISRPVVPGDGQGMAKESFAVAPDSGLAKRRGGAETKNEDPGSR